MMGKTFDNEGGNIRVIKTHGINAGRALVEMLHLWDANKSGCVVCFWIADKEGTPEIQVVCDRLTSTKYSFDILEALKYGQQLAELIAKSDHDDEAK